jgi:ATP-binding cassette subfamily F protein 3
MRIAHLESRQKELTAELEKPEVYAPGGPVMELNRELMSVADELEHTTAEWEKLAGESAKDSA